MMRFNSSNQREVSESLTVKEVLVTMDNYSSQEVLTLYVRKTSLSASGLKITEELFVPIT